MATVPEDPRVTKRRGRWLVGVLVIVGVLVATAAGLALRNNWYAIWAIHPPFPAEYVAIAGPAASVHFERNGTVTALNLPVWTEKNCVAPVRVSGEGRWFQDAKTGKLWIEIDGQRVSWGPDVWWGDYRWDKIIMPHCEVTGSGTQTLFAQAD